MEDLDFSLHYVVASDYNKPLKKNKSQNYEGKLNEKLFPSFDSFSSLTNKALKSLKCFYKVHSAAHETLELEVNTSPNWAPTEGLSLPNRGTERALTSIGKSKEIGKEWI